MEVEYGFNKGSGLQIFDLSAEFKRESWKEFNVCAKNCVREMDE